MATYVVQPPNHNNGGKAKNFKAPIGEQKVSSASLKRQNLGCKICILGLGALKQAIIVQNAKAREAPKCLYITNDACKVIQNDGAAEALSTPTGITFSHVLVCQKKIKRNK